tara:strand:+ start:49 stop:2163 length:2115 start_codon:yes stop_codon:yes gene_type:complete
MDTRIISLDIETYGAVEQGQRGNFLPKQTVFHPTKSIDVDNVELKDLIVCASITLVKEDQCEIQRKLWSPQDSEHTKSRTMTQEILPSHKLLSQAQSSLQLKNLSPTETMVFNLSHLTDRNRLRNWLSHSEVIIGMNLPFDIQYLRKDPFFKFALEKQKLIDLSIINYLHDETRQERSLKNLGPILRTHSYENTLKESRFKTSTSEELYEYNAQDTHNTVLAIKELARRIEKDHPDSDKASEFCLDFYSDLLWTIIRMSETGICMNDFALVKLEKDLLERCKIANEKSEKQGYPLEGEGSGKAKQQLMDDAIDLIGNWIRDDLDLTPSKGLVSFTDSNRNKIHHALITLEIEGNTFDDELDKKLRLELIEIFEHAKTHASAQKIVSSYTYPLLRHRRNKPEDKSSKLVAFKGKAMAFPTWYATPTYAKNNEGGSGGTLQGRITCKKPSAQTFPPIIKDCICSRFGGGKIVSMDLSQIELRVAGLLSGDPAFIDAYQNGADLHEERARQLFDDVDDPGMYHERRQVGKMVNFADLFRAGSGIIRKQVRGMSGLELCGDLCDEIVAKRKEHRPLLWKFQEKLIKEARSNKKLILPFTGQSRYFMGGEKYEINEIVNFPIQTTASNTLVSIQNYIHKSMASLNAPNPDIHMFLNIYDAIYFDVRNEKAEEDLMYLVNQAVKFVQDEGYWGMISQYYGNDIPLEYDWS